MNFESKQVQKIFVNDQLHDNQKYFRMTSTKLTSEQKPKQLVDVDELARISQHHASNF